MSDVELVLKSLTAQAFFFPLEMAAAALIFSWPLKRRSSFWLRLALAFPSCTLLMAVFEVLSYQRLYQSAENSEITVFQYCVLFFLLCVLLVWCVHNVRLWEALLCAACAYLMEHLAYCLRTLGQLFLPEGAMEAGEWGYFLSVVVVYTAGYFLFARQMVRDGVLTTTAHSSLALTLITLVVVIGMSVAANTYQLKLAHAVYAAFCCSAVLFGQLQQQKQIRAESELILQQQMWSLHKTQYEMSRESIEIINRKCHDLKHQVAALKHIHDPERREEVIDSLQSAVMIYDAALETGNEILDTVLTEKSLICTRHEIALSCIADGKRLAFMDPIDLYTLVGNALDNAIEAVLLLPTAERLIRLRVQERAGLVFLQIENPYAGTIEIRDGLPVTRKEDKQNHGFGLKSIQDVGEKYHGLITFHTEGGQFVLRLSFPLCEQQLTAEN